MLGTRLPGQDRPRCLFPRPTGKLSYCARETGENRAQNDTNTQSKVVAICCRLWRANVQPLRGFRPNLLPLWFVSSSHRIEPHDSIQLHALPFDSCPINTTQPNLPAQLREANSGRKKQNLIKQSWQRGSILHFHSQSKGTIMQALEREMSIAWWEEGGIVQIDYETTCAKNTIH